jgi:hypothetical protein
MTASEDGASSALKPQGSGWGTTYPIFAFQILPPEAPDRANHKSLGLGAAISKPPLRQGGPQCWAQRGGAWPDLGQSAKAARNARK